MLRIEVWLSELERVRLNFAYRVLNEAGKLLIEAQTLHACTSPEDKLQRLPEHMAALLAPFVAVPPPPK